VERVGTDLTVPYRTYGFNGSVVVVVVVVVAVVVIVLVTKSDVMINHFAPSVRERRKTGEGGRKNECVHG